MNRSHLVGLLIGSAALVLCVWIWAFGSAKNDSLPPPSTEPPARKEARQSQAIPQRPSQAIRPETRTEPESPLIEVIEGSHATSDRWSTTITAVIQYNGKEPVRFAQITYDIMDRDGNRVGTAFDVISDLKPGERWKIKAVYFGSDGDKFRFAGIKGF